MKKLAILILVVIYSLPFGAEACTGLRLIATDKGVVIGRTMEFGFDVQSNLMIVPAGTKLSNSLPDKSKGMHYTSQYGIIGANVMGMEVIVDGINEKGLYVGGFYFPGYASYHDPDPTKAAISLATEDYGTWLLANFATVKEVRENFNNVILVPNPIQEIGGESFPGHFVVHDVTGACVVIEPLNKTLVIYENPIGVFSNSPTFDWHMTNLRNYPGLRATNAPAIELEGIKLSPFGQGSGFLGLPGDFTPPSRFVRAFAFSQSALQLPTAVETVPQVFHIMNAFDIPLGSVRDVHGEVVHHDYTVWTSVSDLKNLTWAYKSYESQTIQSIDLEKALTAAGNEVKVISMKSDWEVRDISTQFK